MKNNNKFGVIVLGGHVQGLGIIRVFGEQKIPVVLIDNTKLNIGRFSKYCQKFYKYENNQLMKLLLDFESKSYYKNWLVIPTNDYQVKVLSENHTILKKHFKISTDSWKSVSLCYNKILTYKTAEKIGIDIPKSFFPESIKELERIEIEYPCIIKPAVMHEFYDKLKKKVFVCNNKAELVTFYKKATEVIPEDQIIIQEIIKGPCENQFSACFLISKNKVISSLSACRKRQHPIDFGNATTYAEANYVPEILKVGERLLKEINYNGLCEVEFKKNPVTNKYILLEINPRTWKWHLLAKKAGVDFLNNLYKITYSESPVINQDINYSVSWRHLVTDIPTFLEMKLSNQYKKTNKKETVYAVWNKNDILPAIFELILLPFLIFKR